MDYIFGSNVPNFYCSAVGLVCRVGDLNRLNELLSNGAPIDQPDNRGWYATHEAAFGNHYRCLEALFGSFMNGTINVNWRAHDGSTALIWAAKGGHYESVQYLIYRGATVDLGTIDELKPLLAAVKSGNVECIEALLDADVDVAAPYWDKWTTLHEAVSMDREDIVELLLNWNADPFATTDDGLTPAFIACQYGSAACLKLLVDAVDAVEDKRRLVNSRSNDGTSCVYIAAQEGYDDCLEILIEHDADVNVCTKQNVHPICVAAKRNYTRCAKLMLPTIDKSVVFYSAEDPVFVAVEEHHPRMLSILLADGFPSNRLTDYFRDFAVPIYRYLHPLLTKTVATPLTCAVAKADLDAVRILLRHKATTVWTNRKTYSPLLLAVFKRRMPELLEELLNADPRLNSISVDSLCRIPDALLVSVHPLYRGQLVAMLKAGLDPRLPRWCLCKQSKAAAHSSIDDSSYSFLRELSGILLPGEFADLIRLLIMFSMCGVPNCCRAWEMALGSRMQEFERFQKNPLSLQHLCRVSIRKCVRTGRLASDDWVDSLPCSPPVKAYLVYKGLF